MKANILKLNFISLILILFAIGITETGCGKDDADSLSSQLDQIDFEIIIMDENETKVNIFEAGEDMILALKAINHSAKELELNAYAFGCELLQLENFLFVNKKSDTYESDSTFIPIGRPYHYPSNCLTINLPYYNQNIPKSETIIVSANWSSNLENEDLIPGKYFTEFALILDIEGYSKTWNLRADFEVI